MTIFRMLKLDHLTWKVNNQHTSSSLALAVVKCSVSSLHSENQCGKCLACIEMHFWAGSAVARSAANLFDPYQVSKQFSRVLTLIISEITNLQFQSIRCLKKGDFSVQCSECLNWRKEFHVLLELILWYTINSAPFFTNNSCIS